MSFEPYSPFQKHDGFVLLVNTSLSLCTHIPFITRLEDWIASFFFLLLLFPSHLLCRLHQSKLLLPFPPDLILLSEG